jgi:hypothetical protein
VDGRRGGILGWVAPALRRLERKLGADREGRTLWVWVVPAATIVVTFVVLAVIGVQGNVDLALTIPMALTLSLFLGSLSAFYLTAASSDERDKEDGPDDRGDHGPPAGPQPPDGGAAPSIVHAPGRPPRAAEQRTPVGSGAAPRR